MVTTALAAPIVTGAALVLLTTWVSRRAHRRSAPERLGPEPTASTGIGSSLQSPRVWGAIFVALVAAGVVGAAQVAGGIGALLVPLVGVLVMGYVIVGTYAAVRARGGGAASAVAAAGWSAGLLAVIAIAGRLVLG